MDYLEFTGTDLVNGVWQDEVLETGTAYGYGDFAPYNGEVTEALKKSLFIRPEHLSGSDYSGSSYTVSNYRVFLKEYGEVEGVYALHGGHGTYAIAIRADVAEENEEIRDTLNALENYPVIDDEDSSMVEIEWQGEAMKDILRDLERNIDLETYLEDCPAIIEKLTTDNDALEELAWQAVEKLNLDWKYENCTAYLDSDSVKPYVEDVLLIDYCPNLPLLINREWSCDDTRERYNTKLSEALW
jgi:hypothetical protein